MTINAEQGNSSKQYHYNKTTKHDILNAFLSVDHRGVLIVHEQIGMLHVHLNSSLIHETMKTMYTRMHHTMDAGTGKIQ